MPVRLEKPWIPLNEATVAALPAQLGVYELGDDAGKIIRIGYAGGTSLFGLRSELLPFVDRATSFRVEVTTAYMTRCRELLMAYEADHGSLPRDNRPEEFPGLGRLSPEGGMNA